MRYDALRLVCFFDLPMETPKEKEFTDNFVRNLFLVGLRCFSFRFIIVHALTEALRINFINGFKVVIYRMGMSGFWLLRKNNFQRWY